MEHKTKGQSKMKYPDKLVTYGTQDEDKNDDFLPSVLIIMLRQIGGRIVI
jgi:hypothetical protein